MREQSKTIVFIASIALNLAFCVTYLIYKIPSVAGVSQQPQRQPVYLQLDLSPEQSKAFRAERDRFHARLQDLGKEIKSRQMELIDLLGGGPLDQRAVEDKQADIQRLQKVVQDGVIAHVLHGSSLLSPEQRTRFFQLIKARIDNSSQTCPPWMKPSEPLRPGEITRND